MYAYLMISAHLCALVPAAGFRMLARVSPSDRVMVQAWMHVLSEEIETHRLNLREPWQHGH